MHILRPHLLAVTCLAALTSFASAQGWGTIKGQFVIEGKVPPPVVVQGLVAGCLAKGPILSEQYVVNPKNKGVRWVAVWITSEKDGRADHKVLPPIHPALVNIPAAQKDVVVDSPCCKFEIKDVPAGKLRIIMWHEGMGWVHQRAAGKKGYDGQGITITADKTLDLGQVPVKAE